MFVSCSGCGKEVYKDIRRINENKKLGYKNFCSLHCSTNSKKRSKIVTCDNPDCNKAFEKKIRDIISKNYCSVSCSVTVNNKNPKRVAVIKQCATCGKDFNRNKKFCSPYCQQKGQEYPSELLIKKIKRFHILNGRIPMKREFKHYSAIRRLFGTWNNAIVAAGYDPNPVMFAKKWVARDGHVCDSLTEKIIDDWLSKNKIIHKIHVKYPGNKGFSVDFLVKDYWIEFFGLKNECRKYDLLRKRKLRLVKKYRLKLIALYSKDIFPKNKLSEKLSEMLT